MVNHLMKTDSSTLQSIDDLVMSSEQILSLLARYQMLSKLRREMAIDAAIDSISYTSEEVAQTRQQFYQQNQIRSEEELQTRLVRQAMTATQLEALITRSLRIEKFKHAQWGHKLESYFLKRKDQLDRVIYSLIRTHEWQVAQELFFRIQAGEQSFADVSKQYSQGVEAQTGGLLGPVALGTLHPTLAQRLVTSQPGQLLTPVRIEEWIVIVQLEMLLPAQLDEPTQQRLLNELFEEWLSGIAVSH